MCKFDPKVDFHGVGGIWSYCVFIMKLREIDYLKASVLLIAMSKSFNCSVNKLKKSRGIFGHFCCKIFASHTCKNITGKDLKIFVMTTFACTEVQIAWDLVTAV